MGALYTHGYLIVTSKQNCIKQRALVGHRIDDSGAMNIPAPLPLPRLPKKLLLIFLTSRQVFGIFFLPGSPLPNFTKNDYY